MGCSESKEKPATVKITVTKSSDRSHLKKEDFIFSRVNGENLASKLLIKEPGSINGQQFIIEDCRKCSVYLLDFIECMTVDNCAEMKFVIGPTRGSIFLRNVSDSIIFAYCQQLRLRDCQNCQIFLFSKTGPIIESSTNIGFACATYQYPGMHDHFTAAGLDIFMNKWSSVFDFTPSNTSEKHYYFTENPSASIIESDLNEKDLSVLQHKNYDLQSQFSAPFWPILYHKSQYQCEFLDVPFLALVIIESPLQAISSLKSLPDSYKTSNVCVKTLKKEEYAKIFKDSISSTKTVAAVEIFCPNKSLSIIKQEINKAFSSTAICALFTGTEVDQISQSLFEL